MHSLKVKYIIGIVVLFFLLVGGGEVIKGQSLKNLRTRQLPVTADTLIIDTLSVIPGSVIVQNKQGNQIVDKTEYAVLPARAAFYWKTVPSWDSVVVNYRVFPYNFSKTHHHKDTSMMEHKTHKGYVFRYNKQRQKGQYSDINWGGSLARGISFGNNQDVTVNSNMNLQVSGQLTKDIEVMGAITDKNIPIQPEGNTQQLQTFDQVYLQFRKDQSRLRAGDIELTNPPAYFMSFSKRVMGAKFETDYQVGDQASMHSKAGVSISKGKYTRNEFRGQEGNQGPYRLKGDNGESYIIILANTEKVYVNGKLMKRGEEHDYVIDYNLGEITFTPNRQITSDSRIIVEFEYATRNYLRSLVHVNQSYKTDRWEVDLNVFAEQDHKNQTKREISEKSRTKMRQVGDSLSKAITSGADTTTYSSNKIQYYSTDTTVNGRHYDSVFVYAQQPREVVYQVRFSNVGKGNGNYVLDRKSLANGKVFKWVAPVNGQPQGNYAPRVQLVTPKKKHMYTLGADYNISPTSTITAEVAISNEDKNTFSDEGDQDDKGFATKIGYNKDFYLSPDKKQGWQISTEVDYEHVQHNFRALERYRPVEFTRDWNLERQQRLNENIARVQTGLEKGHWFNSRYTFSAFLRDTAYQGFKHSWHSNFDQKGFQAQLAGSYLNTRTTDDKTQFFRPRFNLSQWLPLFKGVQVGVKGRREQNRIEENQTDTLHARSFSYDIWEVYAKNRDTLENTYHLNFRQRRNKFPTDRQFGLANVRNTVTLKSSWLTHGNSRLYGSVTYREFRIKDTAHTQSDPDRSVMGRMEYNLTALNGFMRSNTLYEIGQGREQKRQFTYQEVPEGQGYYTWVDRNDDGTPQQVEFEKAYFSDQAQYVRVLLPTDEYQKTHTLKFNQSLHLTPRALLPNQKGFYKFLSRFSSLSYFKMDRKVLETAQISPFNPIATDVSDTALVTLNSNIKNTLYYNRTSGWIGVDVSWKYNQNKMFLVNGARSKTLNERSMNIRWNLTDYLTFRSQLRSGDRINRSFTPTQNYHIDYSVVGPELTYIYQQDFRVTLNYEWSLKENVFPYKEALNYEKETMRSHDVGTELRFTQSSADDISAEFNYVIIDFLPKKQVNSSAAFNMLKGLQPGNNMVWNVTWERQLGDKMQMSLNYEGRSSENTKVIHLGRAQVRYIF